MKRYILLITFISLFFSCAEDDGNYKYSTINTITIDNITADTTYTVIQYDTLRITPELSFAAEPLSDLSYEWKVNYKVISTDPILDKPISEAAQSGDREYYRASLAVTDNKSGLIYYRDFRVTVRTPYSSALFILSEQENEEAMLSFQRRDQPGMPLNHGVYEDANPEFGSLGTQPKQLYFGENFFLVLCNGGQNRMSQLNPLDMKLTRIYNSESIGTYAGDFKPDYVKIAYSGMISAGGELFPFNYMNNQIISPPSVTGYDFAPWVDCDEQMGAYMWISYDNKGAQFISVEDIPNTMGFSLAKTLPVEGVTMTGQKWFAAGQIADGAGNIDKQVILYDNAQSKAHFYSVYLYWDDYDMETWLPRWEITTKKLFDQTGYINQNSICILASKTSYWYLSNGNKLRRMHANGGEVKDWFTAPKGDIVNMMFDSKEERLIIATYDGSKSYIYFFNVFDQEETEEHIEVPGRVVSMLVRGNWTY